MSKTRNILSRGPKPTNVRDLTTWSAEQIRLAGAWSKHELDSIFDPFTAPYDWEPDWTGDIDPMEVNTLVSNYYRSRS
jgi:hypothetical protein